MICPFCGSNVPDGNKFCQSCGGKLDVPESSQAPVQETAPLQQPTPEPELAPAQAAASSPYANAVQVQSTPGAAGTEAAGQQFNAQTTQAMGGTSPYASAQPQNAAPYANGNAGAGAPPTNFNQQPVPPTPQQPSGGMSGKRIAIIAAIAAVVILIVAVIGCQGLGRNGIALPDWTSCAA